MTLIGSMVSTPPRRSTSATRSAVRMRLGRASSSTMSCACAAAKAVASSSASPASSGETALLMLAVGGESPGDAVPISHDLTDLTAHESGEAKGARREWEGLASSPFLDWFDESCPTSDFHDLLIATRRGDVLSTGEECAVGHHLHRRAQVTSRASVLPLARSSTPERYLCCRFISAGPPSDEAYPSGPRAPKADRRRRGRRRPRRRLPGRQGGSPPLAAVSRTMGNPTAHLPSLRPASAANDSGAAGAAMGFGSIDASAFKNQRMADLAQAGSGFSPPSSLLPV